MNSAKSKEEKKFVQISPDTVGHLAESVGISNLSPAVSRALAEDASYRCRELANLCGQFLRQGKRRKLTTQDVERAMKWYNAEPVYGHGAGSNEPGYTRIHETGKSGLTGNLPIFVPDEKLIDLRPYALTQSPAILASLLTVQGSWLTLEGTYLPEKEESKGIEYPSQGSLTPQLIQFFSSVVGVILGDSDQMLQTIYDDIQTNSKIGALLPSLVSFIRTGMQRHCDNQTLVGRLLCLIQALFNNPMLNLTPKPYLSHLVTSLLSSLIIDRSGREHNDFECLSTNVGHVSQASQILRQVLDRWSTPVNQLRSQTLRALGEYLRDGKTSYSSHFGAMSALTALGPEVLDECLLPQMDQYLTGTKEKMHALVPPNLDSNVAREMKKRVLKLMSGTILIASRSMMKHFSENGHEELRSKYELFYKHFGDAILCSTSLPKSGRVRKVQAGHPTGSRVSLRKLRPVTKVTIPNTIKTETEMETDDFYSNSSRQDFNLLADMGVPSDIFEPEHRSLQIEQKSVLSDAPEKISPLVQKFFKVRNVQTVNRNPKVLFALGVPNWPHSRLKRKWVLSPRVAPGFRASGVIAKRFGSDEGTRTEMRQQLLLNNNSYLELIL